MDKETDNGDGVKSVPVPHLIITFEPRNYTVKVGGSVPTWEFGEAMLHMALKETERKISERRVESGIAVAGPELLAAFTRGKPEG